MWFQGQPVKVTYCSKYLKSKNITTKSMIGETILHYKIISKLGEGGMGVVYKAEDTKLDRLVAMQFLPAHLIDAETALSRKKNDLTNVQHFSTFS